MADAVEHTDDFRRALLGLTPALVVAKAVPAGTVRERRIPIGTADAAEAAAAAIRVANPRAKVRVDGGAVVLTVDPPRQFSVAAVYQFAKNGVLAWFADAE